MVLRPSSNKKVASKCSRHGPVPRADSRPLHTILSRKRVKSIRKREVFLCFRGHHTSWGSDACARTSPEPPITKTVRAEDSGPSASKRRRLEPPLCRPLARHRAVSRQLHYGFTRFHSKSAVGSHAQLAARRRLGRASRSIVTPSDHARTTIASVASVSDRSEGPRANVAGRSLRPARSRVSESLTMLPGVNPGRIPEAPGRSCVSDTLCDEAFHLSSIRVQLVYEIKYR